MKLNIYFRFLCNKRRKLYHQNNTDPPLHTNNNTYFKYDVGLSLDYSYYTHLKWETIKYEEERGVPKLLNPFKTEKDDYISGYISSSSSILVTPEKDLSMKYLAHIELENDHSGYSQ